MPIWPFRARRLSGLVMPMVTIDPVLILLLSGSGAGTGADLLLLSGSGAGTGADAVPSGGDDDLLLLSGGTPAVPPVPTPYVPFEPKLAAFLSASLPGIHAWHALVPEKAALPAIAWQVVDGDSGLNLAGPSGLGWWHVQFTVFAPSPADCWTWAEALRLALVGAPGKAAFLLCNAHPRRSGFTAGADDSGKGTHSAMREYSIWYREPRS